MVISYLSLVRIRDAPAKQLARLNDVVGQVWQACNIPLNRIHRDIEGKMWFRVGYIQK